MKARPYAYWSAARRAGFTTVGPGCSRGTWASISPGSPKSSSRTCPGPGGLIATNYTYKVAKQDGTAIVSPLGGQYLDQVAGRKEVLFDFGKFQWLGTQEVSHSVLFCRRDSKFQSVEDLIKNKKEPAKLGNTGTSGSSYFIGKVLENAVGANFNFVMGYQGGSEIDLAVERGEVACRGMTIPPHFGREPYLTWHKTNFITQLIQTGSERDSRMKDVPTLTEVMEKYKTPAGVRAIAKVIFASGDFGRPLGVGPGVPADRVKILRTAYAKALQDPGLMADADEGADDTYNTEQRREGSGVGQVRVEPAAGSGRRSEGDPGEVADRP